MAYISFVFSFYNEEQTLPLLIRRIREVMTKESFDYEMIFVNDASTDDSLKILAQETAAKEKGEIVVVNLSRRFGVEESFLAGIETARGDALILMYTDLQDPPEVVLKMLQCYKEGAEVVHTIRKKRIGEHPLKNIAAFLAYRIVGKLSDIKIPYDAGEFKLISKNVAKHLLNLPEVEPYLRGLIPWVGFKQNYVEYEMQPRGAGRSKIALFGKKAWTVFLSGVISFSDFPIYGILLTGLCGFFVSTALGFFLIARADLGWINGPMALIIFLWSTLMLSLGLVGLYILKTYKNTRGRPRYIIQKIIRDQRP